MYCIFKTLNPEVFQGKNKSKNYFEGWYFKLVDESEKNVFAVIPGISYGQAKADRHAFIQILDSVSYKTHYFKYDISSFINSEKGFNISIEENTFNRKGISLDLDQDNFKVNGTLDFYDIVPYPKTILKPGIMGPYSFIPFMECYHSIVNIKHRIKGSLAVGDINIDLTKGIGYIEKDWGRSFPEWWVWIHSNHFEDDNVSLMFSVAKIPWLRRYFTGFVSFLKVEGKLYRFATYTGAKIDHLEYKDEKIYIKVSDNRYSLTVSGKYKKSGILKAPQNGFMHRKISESISSDVDVSLEDRRGNYIFKGSGKNAGMEIVGDGPTSFQV